LSGEIFNQDEQLIVMLRKGLSGATMKLKTFQARDIGPVRHNERPASVPIAQPDLLIHLADMAAEMRALAQRVDAALLARIFDLAQKEALQQVVVAKERLRP
jgi:hypothetical protein